MKKSLMKNKIFDFVNKNYPEYNTLKHEVVIKGDEVTIGAEIWPNTFSLMSLDKNNVDFLGDGFRPSIINFISYLRREIKINMLTKNN